MTNNNLESQTVYYENIDKENPIHVLHVDDETGLLSTTKQILEMQGPFQVDSASSVEEAYAKLDKKEFDVIVSDYQMPTKDGLVFLEELREGGKDIPFILFTGKGREDVAIKALNLGADYFMNKLGRPETVYGELAHIIQQVVKKKRTEIELDIERQRLETITKTMSAGLTVISKDFRILWANDALKKIFGADYEGKKCFALINHLKSQCAGCGVREIFEKGCSQVVHEQLVKDAMGQNVWLEITVTPIKDTKGNVTAALELVNNITERKKMDVQIKDSEERFRQLFSNMPSGVAVYEGISNGEDFVFKDFNKAAEQIEKLSRTDVIGKRVTEVFPSVKNFGLFDVFQRVHRSGLPEYFPTKLYQDNRESGWRENWVYRLPNNDIVAVYNDVSEQKKAEEALIESEKKFRTYIENSPTAVFVANQEAEYEYVNEAASKMLGYSKEELVNMSIYQISDDQSDLSSFKRLIKEGKINVELALRHKNGQPIYVNLNGVKLANGKLIAFCENITPRKNNEMKVNEEIALRESLLNNLPCIAMILKKGTREIVASNKMARELGAVPGETCFAKCADRNDSCPFCLAQKLWETNEPQSLEVEYRDKWYRGIWVPYNNDLYIHYIFDITKSKQAEKKLEESEKKYKKQFEEALDAIFLADAETGTIIDCNRAAAKLVGRKKSEIIGQHQRILHPLEDLKGDFTDGFKKHSNMDPSRVLECRVITKNGEIRDVEIKAAIFETENRRIMQGTFHDITKRKRAEKALQVTEERFRQVAENAVDWIWEVDIDGLYTYSSPAVAKLLGYKPEELVGKKHFYDLFPSKDLENLKKAAFLAFKEKQPFHEFVNVIVHKNGTFVWLSTSGVPILDDQGKLLGYRGATIDITDRKKAENTMDTMVNDLGQVIEKLRVVGKSTRHDARNKLTVIANNVYLAKKRLAAGQNTSEYLDDIESAIGQIVKIFDFSRTYEMIGVEERSYINTETSVKEAALLFSGLVGTKIKNECRGLTVLANSQLRQLFYNLIDNSLNHGEKVTKIRAYYEEKENQLKMIYEDNGVGIPENEKNVIFKEGYGKNTGYGLYIIQKICESYGWTIKETGKHGKGAQFTITIPKTNKNGETAYQLH